MLVPPGYPTPIGRSKKSASVVPSVRRIVSARCVVHRERPWNPM